ncbi:hypothetical protein DFA_03341 [Cavenderia fasciculata]|uniref:Uncharacterized protein n=1 Tax=Cavenderia fasciculata TaxID=261658 RepID=F4PHB1_CACFS|nr:uncharacterized protein DFA_03341 [Cavenderia fasciculata]EGG25095.1 hypothetical protein DFA_03341 [Cavenderia fasciculata]|eukprot:XP_004362946.1 hypothetical protein DFA_03341 [Cavenderia fasciculata]
MNGANTEADHDDFNNNNTSISNTNDELINVDDILVDDDSDRDDGDDDVDEKEKMEIEETALEIKAKPVELLMSLTKEFEKYVVLLTKVDVDLKERVPSESMYHTIK